MRRVLLPVALLLVWGCKSTSHTDSSRSTGQRYSVVVHTSDKDKAGTNAKVCIEGEGSASRTVEIQLDRPDYDDFQRNDMGTYAFEHAPLGEIRDVCMRHDNSGPDPGWHLDYVIIEDQKTGERWQADFQRWIA